MPDSGRSVCGSDVCIDIEATICLVMRVERDESRVMDVSDVVLVDREAVHKVLCSCVFARQGRHCYRFDELGRHNSRAWKDLTTRTAASFSSDEMEPRVVFTGVLTHIFVAQADCGCYKVRFTDKTHMVGLWSS